MTLRYISNQQTWKGERINGIAHPRNIEQLWTDENLANIGLERYTPPPPPPPPTNVADIKAEAQRRIALLVGVTDDNLDAVILKELNALMRGIELNNKIAEGGTLTTEEEAEKQALMNLSAGIKAIRAKSNEIEQMNPLPADETDDALWI